MQAQTPISVSALNKQAKSLLEGGIGRISVRGEISNLSRPSSGHLYLTLKDSGAQIQCAFFRNSRLRSQIKPENGMQVVADGYVSLYEARGSYQLIIEKMSSDGEGQLQQAFFALKAKLDKQGLFDPSVKKPLPPIPGHVVLITSPNGAAIKDIEHVLSRRAPYLKVALIPVSVQGDEAPEQLISALQKADALKPDVILIGRGGGSIEDLWAFNNEALAHAIYNATTPIISAVGHEIDYTIADFTADVRAPTPSAAAEILAPDINDLFQRLDHYQSSLTKQLMHKLDAARQQVKWLEKRLITPQQQLAERKQRLNLYQQQLNHLMEKGITRSRVRLEGATRKLNQASPDKHLLQQQHRLQQLSKKLSTGIAQSINQSQQRLAANTIKLEALSPLKVLTRGYSILAMDNGNIVTDTTHINKGDQLQATLANGSLELSVISSKRNRTHG